MATRKPPGSPPTVVTNHRDAGTGKFVTERYTELHKKTTVTEHNKVPPKSRGK